MSAKRKISIRKVIQTLVTLVLVAGVTMAILSADRQHSRRLVRDVRLAIDNPSGVEFLTDEAVRKMLFTSRHMNPYTQVTSEIDERAMEAILRANPWVKDAQVYIDADRVMHIILTQRVPVVRIFEEDGNSYYLDAALQAMPLSSQYTHYTPVVTGVPPLLNDPAADVVRGNIVGLVNFFGARPFWNSQVSQVEMRADGGFELIPVLGNQRVILGDTVNLEQKLGNLLAFYRQIQNRIGWDKYKTIDLRFAGEVVASPALQWKRPLDAALSNMSWLKAIMDHAPATQNQPGGDAPAFPDSLAGSNSRITPTAGANRGTAMAPQRRSPAVPSAAMQISPQGHAKPVLLPKLKPATSPAAHHQKVQNHIIKPHTGQEKNNKPHAATTR